MTAMTMTMTVCVKTKNCKYPPLQPLMSCSLMQKLKEEARVYADGEDVDPNTISEELFNKVINNLGPANSFRSSEMWQTTTTMKN